MPSLVGTAVDIGSYWLSEVCVCVLSLFVDKPKFLCSREVYVKINEPNYNLVCKVHANPDVRFAHVTFVDPNDSNHTIDTLEDSANNPDYEANVTVGVSTITTLLHCYLVVFVAFCQNG